MKRILVLLCLSILAGCSKDAKDVTPPVITLTSPANNQQFTAGQVVNIDGTVTDDDQIHEVHIYVINKATSAEVLHSEQHLDSKSFTIAQHFTVVAGVTYQIRVQANDHTGNENEKDLEVNSQ
jgi:hypothetical protein